MCSARAGSVGGFVRRARFVLILSLSFGFLLGASAPLANSPGNLQLHLSLPHINTFYLQPEGELDSKFSIGFMGAGIGVSVEHARDQYLLLSASGVMDFFLPIPAAVDILGEWESTTSVYLGVTNNHALAKFSFGYGLWFGWNTWRFHTDFSVPATHEPATVTNRSAGFLLPVVCRLNHATYLGLTYRPGILQFGSRTKLRYEHLISVELSLRVNLN